MFRRLWLRMAVFLMLILLWCLINQRKKEQKEQPQLKIEIDAGEKIQPSATTTHPEVSAVQEENQEPDDLTQISGIGPKISAILQDAGIINYAQLAEADEEEIRQTLSEAGLRLGDPGSWIQQSQTLTHGD
ncbi:helix-hairpin-helix domain-containing protein [Chloroflexota bacterium]